MTQELRDTMRELRANTKALVARVDHLVKADEEEGRVLEELVAYFKRKDETETQKMVDEIMEMIGADKDD